MMIKKPSMDIAKIILSTKVDLMLEFTFCFQFKLPLLISSEKNSFLLLENKIELLFAIKSDVLRKNASS